MEGFVAGKDAHYTAELVAVYLQKPSIIIVCEKFIPTNLVNNLVNYWMLKLGRDKSCVGSHGNWEPVEQEKLLFLA
jgi:hypothetical protein